MRDAADRPLYVGAAGDLRQRTLSYFRGAGTPRPVERVLPAVERLEFREAGSPFEARLDEIGLIGELRPGANRQGARPDRLAYLRLERERPAAARHRRHDRRRRRALRRAGRPARGRPTTSPARCASRSACAPAAPPGRSRRAASRAGSGAASRPAAAPAERAAHAAAAAALAAALQGGGVPHRRGCAQRRATLAADQRFEEAARLRDAEVALRAAGAELRRVRGAPARCTAWCWRAPRPAPGGGVRRRLRARGRAAAAAARRRRRRSRRPRCAATRRPRRGALGPAPKALTPSPADRRDEALHVAAAFARPASRARRGRRRRRRPGGRRRRGARPRLNAADPASTLRAMREPAHFADRLAARVEAIVVRALRRHRPAAAVSGRLPPRPARRSRRPGPGDGALRRRPGRGGRAGGGRGQAPGGVLRGARRVRPDGARARLRDRHRARRARDRRRQARRHPVHRRGLRRGVARAPPRRRAAARRRADREPVPRPRLARAVRGGMRSGRRGDLRPRAHLESRIRRPAGARAAGRRRLGGVGAARRGARAGRGRRLRAVLGRRRDRPHPARGAAARPRADADGAAADPRPRRPGRRRQRRRARLHAASRRPAWWSRRGR